MARDGDDETPVTVPGCGCRRYTGVGTFDQTRALDGRSFANQQFKRITRFDVQKYLTTHVWSEFAHRLSMDLDELAFDVAGIFVCLEPIDADHRLFLPERFELFQALDGDPNGIGERRRFAPGKYDDVGWKLKTGNNTSESGRAVDGNEHVDSRPWGVCMWCGWKVLTTKTRRMRTNIISFRGILRYDDNHCDL